MVNGVVRVVGGVVGVVVVFVDDVAVAVVIVAVAVVVAMSSKKALSLGSSSHSSHRVVKAAGSWEP